MRRVLVMTLVLAVVGVLPAFAQGDRGQIAGFIKDQTGGVIPGATVTVTNSQTRLTWTAVTDGRGYYVIPSLPPGAYEITVELQGFKRWIQTGMNLDAASSSTVDVTLETGGLTETVSVTAEATPLQTDVAVRKTVEAKDIELMSFSGRNPIGVVGLKAGVMGGNFNSRGFDDLGNGGFNINGSRPDENNISVDGATAIRTRSSGNIIGIQNVDAIQEVQVLTANYMPEYGRASGGQIRFVTKSGSNRYSWQRLDLLPRRIAAGQYVDAQPQHQPGRKQRPGPVRLPAVRVHDRRTDTGKPDAGPVLLLRRAGVRRLLRARHQHRNGADRGNAERRFQRAAEPGQRFLQRRPRHHRPAHGPAVSEQCHSAIASVAQWSWRY